MPARGNKKFFTSGDSGFSVEFTCLGRWKDGDTADKGGVLIGLVGATVFGEKLMTFRTTVSCTRTMTSTPGATLVSLFR